MPIRTFKLDADYGSVVALWRAAGPGVRLGASDSPVEIARKLRRDPDLFLVAEEAGQIVGAVLGAFDGRRGMVYHLAVAPEQRRRGLGTALLAELEARLKAKGCRKCYLVVTDDNGEALDFYRRSGWQAMPVHLLGKEIG